MACTFEVLPPEIAEWMGLDETVLPLAVALVGDPADPVRRVKTQEDRVLTYARPPRWL